MAFTGADLWDLPLYKSYYKLFKLHPGCFFVGPEEKQLFFGSGNVSYLMLRTFLAYPPNKVSAIYSAIYLATTV
jgi:hypothetical protein